MSRCKLLLLFSAIALVSATETCAQGQRSQHGRAIAAIRELGGQVTVAAPNDDGPVSVTLTGSGRPADCLPYLKDVRNLQTCDL